MFTFHPKLISLTAVIIVLGTTSSAWSDIVIDWNNVCIRSNRADKTLPGPTHSSKMFAIVHLGIYDAINTIHRTHEPYLIDATAAEGTSEDAAVAQVAHDLLVSIYPAQSATLDAELANSLASIPDGTTKTAGIDLGAVIAREFIQLRSVDNGFDDPGDYPDGTLPGEWRRTAPNFADPLGPLWGEVTPFGVLSGSHFRSPEFPALASAEYAEALKEVKDLGSVDSATRTADQTEIGLFWAYDRGQLGPPPILYNQIIQEISSIKGNTPSENARLFALANMAQADAGIVCWESKYVYDFWRPITGIQEADTDGNSATIADASWTPLGAPGGGVVPDFTPPFPAYPSGHATFGGALFEILRLYYGTDDVSFEIGSDELPGVTRSYSSFTQASEENAISRIYLGVHWRFDATYGIEAGTQVADYIYANHLRPIVDGDLDKDGDCDGEDLLLFQKVWKEKL